MLCNCQQQVDGNGCRNQPATQMPAVCKSTTAETAICRWRKYCANARKIKSGHNPVHVAGNDNDGNTRQAIYTMIYDTPRWSTVQKLLDTTPPPPPPLLQLDAPIRWCALMVYGFASSHPSYRGLRDGLQSRKQVPLTSRSRPNKFIEICPQTRLHLTSSLHPPPSALIDFIVFYGRNNCKLFTIGLWITIFVNLGEGLWKAGRKVGMVSWAETTIFLIFSFYLNLFIN